MAHVHGATLNDVVLTAVAGRCSTCWPAVVKMSMSSWFRCPCPGGDQVLTWAIRSVRPWSLWVLKPTLSSGFARLLRPPSGSNSRAWAVRVAAGWLFRGLATVQLGQFFVDHQRLVHTFRDEPARAGPSRCPLQGACWNRSCRSQSIQECHGVVRRAVVPGGVVIAVVADPRRCPTSIGWRDCLKGSWRN